MQLRHAQPTEADALTQITLTAKAHWGYTDEQMRRWKEELTVTPGYIARHHVILAEERGDVLGYISVVENAPPREYQVGEEAHHCRHVIDNLFVHPFHHRRGIGEGLLSHTLMWCRRQGIHRLYVFSDPNASGFYRRMGGVLLGEVPAHSGGRPLPLFVFRVAPAAG